MEIPLTIPNIKIAPTKSKEKLYALFEQPSGKTSNYPNQHGSMQMKDEVLSSVSIQDMDTCRYKVSDLDDTEFFYESDPLEVDAVFRPGTDNPFSARAFDELEMGATAKNHILPDEKENKKSPPTTPVYKRPT